MSNEKSLPQNVIDERLMWDEYRAYVYNVGSNYRPHELLVFIDIHVRDSGAEIKQCAERTLQRIDILTALFSNPELTNDDLMRIVLSTGSRLPDSRNIADLPPAY